MRILHICNGYCGSKVHSELYRRLDALGIEQIVYAYYRGRDQEGKNQFEGKQTQFYYRPILKLRYRILYHQKLRTVSNDLRTIVGREQIDLIHATTLFSDGPIAYRLWKERGISYVVTVRNTDINEFLAVAPWTWSMGFKVLRHAKKIVFISKAPMKKFCQHWFIKRILPKIKDRFVLQPNGVDDYWLDHVQTGEKKLNHNLIYVGRFDVNKNVVRLIHAVIGLKERFPDIKLHLVGGDGAREKQVLELVREYPQYLEYHGKIYDKDVLRGLYSQCNVFAMPSIHETFGLVYIEALTQGLAVIYTQNQGIDGLLDERVGEKVNAWSTDSIQTAISIILDHRSEYISSEVINFEMFRWERIAILYQQIYKSIIEV